MTDQTIPRPTDTERLAGWAVLATEEGRFELAEALLRLAIQAQRVERDNTPPPAPAYTGPRLVNPIPTDDQVVPKLVTFAAAAVQNGATAIIERPLVTAPNRRCQAIVGETEECGAGVGWDATAYRWYHVDPELDRDHFVSVRDQ